MADGKSSPIQAQGPNDEGEMTGPQGPDQRLDPGMEVSSPSNEEGEGPGSRTHHQGHDHPNQDPGVPGEDIWGSGDGSALLGPRVVPLSRNPMRSTWSL